MKNRLMERGLFPETLPPCFLSVDCTRAFSGLQNFLDNRQFSSDRYSSFVNYSGTKHDGNRRPYATPHPISYYYICRFVASNWKTFSHAYRKSKFSVSTPSQSSNPYGRAVTVSSPSNLSNIVDRRMRYSPFILRADISQFFPSIYTHVVTWAAHGKSRAKKDRNHRSRGNRFNRLDFFIRNAQAGQSRGVLIGPDVYRVIAEFVASKIDLSLEERASKLIIGAARHVDDFYIG